MNQTLVLVILRSKYGEKLLNALLLQCTCTECSKRKVNRGKQSKEIWWYSQTKPQYKRASICTIYSCTKSYFTQVWKKIIHLWQIVRLKRQYRQQCRIKKKKFFRGLPAFGADAYARRTLSINCSSPLFFSSHVYSECTFFVSPPATGTHHV